jgi:hydrogenase maturation factor
LKYGRIKTIILRMIFPPGKLNPEILKKFLKTLSINLPDEVKIGPRYGEDAAVIELEDKFLVISSDPITFVTEEIGYYLVTINANDIAVMGAVPKYLLITILLPEGKTDESFVSKIFKDVEKASREVGINIIGGHTEVTYGIDRPILMGTAIGFAERKYLVTSGGAKPGDILLLTKGIAVEGTSIIAKEREDYLLKYFSREFIEKAKRFNRDPGISVVKEAIAAARTGKVSAMHDPTEGGIAMGICELAEASGVGVHIYRERIPIFEETLLLSSPFNINPLGLIASGALLISVPGEYVEVVENSIRNEGIEVYRIGEIREREHGLKMEVSGKIDDLPPFPQDEIVKIYR